MSNVTHITISKPLPPIKVVRLMDSMDIGDKTVACNSCMTMAFGLKRKSKKHPYVAVCLGCGEETTIYGDMGQ